ncbi:MAG: ABC transporter ATP-binding protein [bacterium]
MSETPAISIQGLDKVYGNGLEALKDVNLEIESGEIFSLLGPNGAGKTTLINAICGIVQITDGRIRVDGYDNVREYRKARSRIGLVPQELLTDAFESVWDTVTFSRELFGNPPDPEYIETLLHRLSLADKKDEEIRMLSGGMKRRVMIAKALSHEPEILFLDEPTAGVDVELRKSMWEQVLELRETGVTIILTTHYLEEAEEMADRIGVIDNGELIKVEQKSRLMEDLGKKELVLELARPLTSIPDRLSEDDVRLENENTELIYTYPGDRSETGVSDFMDRFDRTGVDYQDMSTRQRSLEEIFVDLVNGS